MNWKNLLKQQVSVLNGLDWRVEVLNRLLLEESKEDLRKRWSLKLILENFSYAAPDDPADPASISKMSDLDYKAWTYESSYVTAFLSIMLPCLRLRNNKTLCISPVAFDLHNRSDLKTDVTYDYIVEVQVVQRNCDSELRFREHAIMETSHRELVYSTGADLLAEYSRVYRKIV